MKDLLKISGVCGILAPVVAYTFIFISIANAPWFSWQLNALSDLGAHAGSDLTFNFGLMIAGVLELIFSIGLYIYFKDTLSKIGSIFLILDSIALFGIGLFPETAGRIHFYVSVMFFVMFPLGYLVFSIAFLLRRNNFLLVVIALLGTVASIIIWSFPWSSLGITGVAIPEFLSSLIGSLWVIAMSIELYRKSE
ncbi:MAG: DUF998 domain-containing protein [Candidatus Asgardarchaeum sp.]